MRTRFMRRAVLGTAATFLAAGAVVAGAGSAAAGGHPGDGYDRGGYHDCRCDRGHFGGYYGYDGLGGILDWIL